MPTFLTRVSRYRQMSLIADLIQLFTSLDRNGKMTSLVELVLISYAFVEIDLCLFIISLCFIVFLFIVHFRRKKRN